MHLWRHARIPDIRKICGHRVAQQTSTNINNAYLLRIGAHNIFHVQLIVKISIIRDATQWIHLEYAIYLHPYSLDSVMKTSLTDLKRGLQLKKMGEIIIDPHIPTWKKVKICQDMSRYYVKISMREVQVCYKYGGVSS